MSPAMDNDAYLVVVNDEEQYSIWPAHRALPLGWRAVQDQAQPKQDCLSYIESHWLDMRPRSAR